MGLSTGEEISSDAIIFCTGWNVGCNSLFDPFEGAELGVSAPLDSLSEEYSSHWQKLDAAAEKYVLESYPLLKTAPKMDGSIIAAYTFDVFGPLPQTAWPQSMIVP